MSNELLNKLIEAVQNASPVIWDAALRRVYVVIVADLIWSVIFLAAAYWLLKYTKKNWEDWYEDVQKAFSVIGISVFLLFGLLELTSALMWLGSPNYAAIKLILEMVK